MECRLWKNLYQHGNPYLTNIDLSLVKKGTAATDDENAISNLNGISYYTSGIENSFRLVLLIHQLQQLLELLTLQEM